MFSYGTKTISDRMGLKYFFPNTKVTLTDEIAEKTDKEEKMSQNLREKPVTFCYTSFQYFFQTAYLNNFKPKKIILPSTYYYTGNINISLY